LLGQEANERAMDPVNACGGVWVPFLDLDQVIRRYQGSWHIIILVSTCWIVCPNVPIPLLVLGNWRILAIDSDIFGLWLADWRTTGVTER
jgi:hypothetical protein